MGTGPRPVLFLTSPEYGQANVVLAAAQELARSPEHDIYIASFKPLRQRVEDINVRNERLAQPVKFVQIPGLSAGTTAQRQLGNTSKWVAPPGFMPAAKSYKGVEFLLMGDSPSEYIQTYNACLQIIKDVKPAAVVCDILLIAGHDAIRALKLDYVVISPCSGKEVVGATMPGMPMMLKQSSGMSYPLSAIEKLKNICLFFCFAYSVILGPTFARIRKARKEAGIKHSSPMYEMYTKRHLYIAPHLPEADWDELRSTPSNLVVCGPIVMPSLQDDTDSGKDLLKWMGQRPTVMVNLGSLHGAEGPSSLAIARGLQTVLDSNNKVQVLWKLKYDWAQDPDMGPLLRPHVEGGRMRVTPWLDIEPAGIPHLVLPIWWDTYEYAERVKYHGIGTVGNVGVAPAVEPEQFAKQLLQALGDEDIKRKAAELGAVCKRRGEGREIAAAAIAKWAQEHKSWPQEG
ncbi:Hypothetical protein D9617_1g082740 [Elsinoe fawcettii]|nr:Hypothetical protein D9617_1g082740 [Elsinoe fawcettii]